MNSKIGLAEFDQTISFLLSNENDSELASFLVDVFLKNDQICSQRKYTFRNILYSKIDIFQHVLLSLSCQSGTLFRVNVFLSVIPADTHDNLTSIFFDFISAKETVFSRIDGRRRNFVSKQQLSRSVLESFEYLVGNLDIGNKKLDLQKILFEEISPVDIRGVETSYWHIDALRDQIKVVIPINEMSSLNAPMRYLNEVRCLSQYGQEIWAKLHTVFKISGLAV